MEGGARAGDRDEEDRDPGRRVQRGVHAGPRARPHPARLPAADRRGAGLRRPQPGRHLPRRARLPAARQRPARSRSSATRRTSGYGGNQKGGYRWAIEHGLDIVVLLHGDGQYAPELLPEMVAPLERGESDAVFGSRMMEPGEARRGGMPLYKYVGNRILTTFENAVVGTDLTEWHSGYRAYSVARAARHPVRATTPTASTSTPQIIIQLHEAGKRIVEIPIPTYYGDEICYVNGIKYARDITRRRRCATGPTRWASAPARLAFATRRLRAEGGRRTRSHGRDPRAGCERGRPRGCSTSAAPTARSARRSAPLGHEVAGVDVDELAGVARPGRPTSSRPTSTRASPPRSATATTSCSPPTCSSTSATPSACSREAGTRLAPGGIVVASVPNFAHWYPRARVALGRFDYDRRGILDRGPRALLHPAQLRAHRRRGRAAGRRSRGGRPAARGRRPGRPPTRPRTTGRLALVGRAARPRRRSAVWPTLFAYQFLFELERREDAG